MLRDYQAIIKHRILTQLRSGVSRAVLGTLPTGSGKTVIMADIFREWPGASVAIAHRQELVGQISIAMARAGVVHRLIAPRDIIHWIVGEHVRLLGKSFYNPKSDHAVAGVDTLIKHQLTLRDWASQVQLWEIDEAHHVLETNKWGKAVSLFPNAVGIGWTATPRRADRKSLKIGQGGVFYDLVVGPTMRDLIDQGHLSDYRYIGPPPSIDTTNIKIGPGGDFVPEQLRAAARKSQIVGDIVQHYQRFTPGKLGVTFVVDVESANETAAAFNAQGIKAAVVTAKTPAAERARLVRQFEERQFLQLINVDIFGEGFDLPAIEVVIMGRPTMSYGLFVQQWGRALRVFPGKEVGIIIDPVRNLKEHGLPDRVQAWSLEAPPKRKRGEKDDELVKICKECFQPYEPFKRACPHCGKTSVPTRRDKPEFVEGDLMEFDPALLEKMRGEAEKIMSPIELNGKDPKSRIVLERWNERTRAQVDLRGVIAWWAGYHKHNLGLDDSEGYRIFYRRFGVDVATAQTLSAREARELAASITEHVVELRLRDEYDTARRIEEAESLGKINNRRTSTR